jgi:hypothetical protein
MSRESVAPSTEFRPYRRFVAWFVLCFVSLGSAYLLVSVGVTIYRRRNAVSAVAAIGRVASQADLESCAEELTDVEQELERHLENFHHLFAHYDAAEAQRWSEDQSFWFAQWRAAGQRCRYDQPRVGRHAKEWEQLGVAHAELRETEASYTKELLRFGQNQAPRLDRIRERLEKVNRRLTVAEPDPDDHTPSKASSDSGAKP